MTENIKGLIEKIQQEGVQAAEEKARAIEGQAKTEAIEIVSKAKRDAERLVSEAKTKISRMEQGTKDSLVQAGRDMLIVLKKEIQSILDRVIASRVRQALPPDEMSGIIASLIKEYGSKSKEKVVVTLKKDDLDKLRKGLMSQFKDEAQKGIVLKSSDDVLGGFVISFDSGKSHYDWTDNALAEYISQYLRPELKEILEP